jgi:hypothetical protein
MFNLAHSAVLAADAVRAFQASANPTDVVESTTDSSGVLDHARIPFSPLSGGLVRAVFDGWFLTRCPDTVVAQFP